MSERKPQQELDFEKLLGIVDLPVKAGVPMLMAARELPGQLSNIWKRLGDTFLLFRSFVFGGSEDGLAALCDRDPECKAFAFSAVKSSVREDEVICY